MLVFCARALKLLNSMQQIKTVSMRTEETYLFMIKEVYLKIRASYTNISQLK